jgi:uncharacterized protein (DUF58 family)
MSAVPVALRRFIDTWLYQLRSPQREPIVLVHRRVFILPTTHGLIFFLVLLLMLAGSINYGLSLGFVLTFLLAGLGLNGILHTFRNIANLHIRSGRAESVFAGEAAQFWLRIENPTRIGRGALEAISAAGDRVTFDVEAGAEAQVPIAVPAPRRGRLRLGRIVLESRFPLGLFRAWSPLEPEHECIVFPRPEPEAPGLPAVSGDHGQGAPSMLGNEDFAGLRAYHPGDSPRRIAWKADAREQGLLSKLFTGHADAHVWLDYEQLPANLGVEGRLSRLTRWVLDADAARIPYGLRLTPTVIDPAIGSAHRLRCLRALALYGSEEQPAIP